ncbi:MAG: GAF domain-containing protein [Cyanobacteria bacterium P01_D01_bin.56]
MNLSQKRQFQGAVYNPAYPGELEAIFHQANSNNEQLSQVLAVLGSLLKCDCCFLYLRNPQGSVGKITHCWTASEQYSDRVEADWHTEPKTLLDSSLLEAAIATEHSVFVENIDIEYPDARNTDRLLGTEQALAQGHIVKQDQLWGILRVCVFERSRTWMQFDRSLVIHSVQRLLPVVINYVEASTSEQDSA